MKVLVVGTGGALGGSGITTAADQTVRTLEAMGHDATRLVTGSRLRRRPNRLNVENVVAVIAETVAVARAARRVRPDVVWLHTFGVPTLPALRTLAQVIAVRVVGPRVLVRFHAFALEEHVAQARWLQRLALRSVSALSAALVAEHEQAASALRRVVGHGCVAVLHNWVDVPAEPTPPPPGPPYTAVFVGGLIERKGVPQLIEAMRLLGDVPLTLRLVGGPGDEGVDAAAEVRRRAADLVERGAVVFVGERDAAGVREELRRAHLFVLQSRAEGMPLAMLEALAEARPVLVSDAGNMAEIVRQAGCGTVVASREPAAIAEGIRDALADLDALAERSQRAYTAAVEWFSEAAASRRLADVLSATIAPQVGPDERFGHG